MTLPISTIKTALEDWLSDSTGLPVVWQFQNKPEPDTPFVSVNPVTSTHRQGLFDEAVVDDSTGVSTIVGHRTIMASIQACGSGAYAALTTAQDKLEAPSLYDGWFYNRGLSAQTGDIRNLTGMKGSRYEQRAQMDVTITCLSSTLTDDSGYFDTVVYDSPDLHIPETTITGA